MSQNVGTHGSCVHPIRLTSKQVDELTSRQLAGHWSGRTSRASLHAFANEKTQKEANEKTQEPVGTHGSCVHPIRWTSKQVDKLTSWQLTGHWSGRTSRASLQAFANEKTQKEVNEKTQEHVGTHGSCVHSIRLTSKQVDELAVNKPLERTHGSCVPTCAMHATRQGKQNKRIFIL